MIILRSNHRLYSAISSNKGILIYGEYENDPTDRDFWITGGFLIEDCPNFAMWYIHNYNSQNDNKHGLKAAFYALNTNAYLYACTMAKNSTGAMYASTDAVRADYAQIQYYTNSAASGESGYWLKTYIESYVASLGGSVSQALYASGNVPL